MPQTTPKPQTRRRPRWARWLLSAAALGLFGAGPIGSGCATGFDPPSNVNSLRILAVVADKPYVQPGEEVTFKMTYSDGLAASNREPPRPIQITWLGGCFDPEGDQYFACFPQLQEVFEQIASGEISPFGYVSQGVGIDAFTLEIPEDIISRRPRPDFGPYAGIAYVFFAACAGVVRPIPIEQASEAGSFPLGCFDYEGNRLGPDSFVPGYTQVYAFDDERTNDNPTLEGLTLDGEEMSEEFAEIPKVKACDLTEDERLESGCSAKDPAEECTLYELKAIIPSDVAEVDPGDGVRDGETLTESVWISYFADGGDIDSGIKLVNDPVEGFQGEFETDWVPPSEPGIYTIWAVLRDARGGSTVLTRLVDVQ